MEEVVRRLRIDATANTQNAEQNLSQLRDTLASLNGRHNTATKAARSHASALKTLSNMTKQAQKHSNFLLDTLKRVVMYRALRAVIKEIVKGFKEGLENAYWFSKGINGDLAAALDNMAVKAQTMKNQMGAAFGGLLQTIMPIIQQIISWITSLTSAITALFSMFGGRGTYLKAVDASAEFAENTKSGAGAAKKMKDYLMGIDELNVIKDPNASGGGGGGANTPDYESMFEERELPLWMQGIQDLMNADMFISAGARLADKLNEIVANWDADGWGKKLGEKIENGIEFAWGFLYGKNTTGTGFSFENVGTKLQEALNGIMEEINPELLGGVLTGKINAILGLVRGFFANYDPKATGLWLSDLLMGAINSIEWGTAGDTVHTAITKLVNSITEFVKGADWEQIGKDIAAFVTSLQLTDILDAFTGLAVELCGAIHDILKGLLEDAWKKVVKWWNDTAYEDGKFSFNKLLEGILEAAGNIQGWFDQHIKQPMIDAINRLFGIDSEAAKQMEKDGKLLPGNLLKGINSFTLPQPLQLAIKFLKWIREDFDLKKLSFEGIGKVNIVEVIIAGIKKLTNPFNGIGLTFSGWISKDTASDATKKDLEKTGSGIMGSILQGLQDKFADLKKWWQDTVTPFFRNLFKKDKGNSSDSVLSALTEEASTPVTFAIDIDGVISAATEAGKKANEAFNKEFYSGQNGFFGDLENEFASVQKTLEEGATKTGGSMEVSITDAIQNVWDYMDTATEGMQKDVEGLLDAVDKKYKETTKQISLDTFSKKNQIVQYIQDGVNDISASVTAMMLILGINISTTVETLQSKINTFISTTSDNITSSSNGCKDSVNSAINSIMDLIDYTIDKTREGVFDLANKFKAQMMDCAGIAIQEIGAIREELDSLNGYTVHTYVITHHIDDGGGLAKSKSAASSMASSVAGFLGFAHGGIIKAAGGLQMPNRGQLFIAREAGAELIGNIGNGQTAVMNNNQIVSSVSAGVAEAVGSVLALNNNNSDDRPIIVELDGREIARATRQGTKANGYMLASNPTFA